MQEVDVFRSPDRRHMTAEYSVEGTVNVCIAEPTKHGVLITQFSGKGEVLDQVHSKGGKVEEALSAYLGPSVSMKVVEVAKYRGLEANVHCASCNGKVVRELDSKRPEEIEEVPVTPIFSCVSCNKRYYNISDAYLKKLVDNNPDMFEKEDLAEKEKNSDAFINTLNQYIVRVFASKKIGRLVIE